MAASVLACLLVILALAAVRKREEEKRASCVPPASVMSGSALCSKLFGEKIGQGCGGEKVKEVGCCEKLCHLCDCEA
jgi:hypothetical protein